MRRFTSLCALVFLFCLLLSNSPICNARERSNLRAIRRCESTTTMRDLRIGAMLGGQVSFLRIGSNAEISTPHVGYHYGFDMLVPINDEFEFQISALGSWKGGTTKTQFGAFGGTGIPVTAKIRLMSINLSLYANYVKRVGFDWDFYGGIGMIPQIEATGRMELDLEGGSQSHDLKVGFDAKDHIFPLNFGLGVHIGARYNSQFALTLWYEHDFLNLLPKQKRFYGAVSSDFLLRHDFSRPFIQSLERLATQAGGISFVYYIKL